MKFCLSIFSVFIFALTLSNCDYKPSCPPDSEEYINITQPLYKDVLQSYTGYDTLKFKSETGVIYTFIGHDGLDSGYTIVYKSPNDNCSPNIKQHKRYYAYFFESDTYPTDLQYFITVPMKDNDGVEFHVVIDKCQYLTSSHLPPLDNAAYVNNLKIDSNNYNNVLKIYQNWTINDISYLYYSVSEGIIKIFFQNGKTLTKVK